MGSLQDSISYGGGRINVGGSTYEIGMRFHVTADTTILSLRWWRSVTGAGIAPEIVRLWRESDITELGRLTSVPDDGAVGWQSADLDTPIDLVASTIYVVTGYFPGAGGQPSGAGPVTPDAPFVFEANYRAYHATTSGFPASNDAGSYIGVDAVAGVAPPDPGDPATIGDLSAWLSTDVDVNTHQEDGLPWRTDANVTTLKGEAEGGSGFAAIKGVVDTIATGVGTLLTRWSAAIATTVQTTSDNVATLLTRWSASLAAALQAMSDDFASFFATTGGTAGGPTGALSGRTAFPTMLWTLVDETDFTFQISWDVPADLYTISLTGIPSRINTVDVDGATWRPRVGWWATRNGDLLGARSFLSWENEYVEDGGRRMPGIVIRTQPEIAGHVQAWRLT